MLKSTQSSNQQHQQVGRPLVAPTISTAQAQRSTPAPTWQDKYSAPAAQQAVDILAFATKKKPNMNKKKGVVGTIANEPAADGISGAVLWSAGKQPVPVCEAKSSQQPARTHAPVKPTQKMFDHAWPGLCADAPVPANPNANPKSQANVCSSGNGNGGSPDPTAAAMDEQCEKLQRALDAATSTGCQSGLGGSLLSAALDEATAGATVDINEVVIALMDCDDEACSAAVDVLLSDGGADGSLSFPFPTATRDGDEPTPATRVPSSSSRTTTMGTSKSTTSEPEPVIQEPEPVIQVVAPVIKEPEPVIKDKEEDASGGKPPVCCTDTLPATSVKGKGKGKAGKYALIKNLLNK